MLTEALLNGKVTEVGRKTVLEKIEKSKIVAIIRGVEPEKCVKAAKAICAGGVLLVEVTFNQQKPESFSETAAAISAVKEALGDRMSVGAGTVLTIEQLEIAKAAGAEFIVSPDTNEDVIRRTVELDMVSLPGAFSATEAVKAHNAGADYVKLFPCLDNADAYLKAIKAPLSHIKFLAVGGITVDNAADFIKAGASGIGVGSALINKTYIENGEFEKITELAAAFVEKVNA